MKLLSVVHFLPSDWPKDRLVFCSRSRVIDVRWISNPSKVTCKNCLARMNQLVSLPKGQP